MQFGTQLSNRRKTFHSISRQYSLAISINTKSDSCFEEFTNQTLCDTERLLRLWSNDISTLSIIWSILKANKKISLTFHWIMNEWNQKKMRNQSGWCISMLKCPEKWFPVIKNTWNNQRLTRNKNMVCDIMTMRLNIRSNSYSLTKNHQKWLLPFDMVRLFVFVLWSTRLFLLYDEYSFTWMNNVCVSGILKAKDEKTNDLVKFDPFMVVPKFVSGIRASNPFKSRNNWIS